MLSGLGGLVSGLVFFWVGGWILWRRWSVPNRQYNAKGLQLEKRWPFSVVQQPYTHGWSRPPVVVANAPVQILDRNNKAIATFNHGQNAVTLLVGYSWDGNSGPALNTHACMQASALHDVWCQAMKKGIYKNSYRNWTIAALEYYSLCRRGGMSRLRAGMRCVAIMAYGLFR